MKRVIYILLMLILSLSVNAENSGLTKQAGDNAYSEERYADAIEVYEQLIETYGGSFDLYYNLGNAYYRDKEIGKAILNYEKALRYAPTDKDAKFNLNIAQKMMKDELPETDEVFFIEWFNTFVNMFSITTWAILGMLSFALMLCFILIYKFRPAMIHKFSLSLIIIFLVFTLISNLSALCQYNATSDNSEAIVMKEELVLRSSPDFSGTELFKVHEGRKVRILDNPVKDWVEVEVDNGKLIVGWVPVDAIERI